MNEELDRLIDEKHALEQRIYEIRQQEFRALKEQFPVDTYVRLSAKVVGHEVVSDYGFVDPEPEIYYLVLETMVDGQYKHLWVPAERCTRSEEK